MKRNFFYWDLSQLQNLVEFSDRFFNAVKVSELSSGEKRDLLWKVINKTEPSKMYTEANKTLEAFGIKRDWNPFSRFVPFVVDAVNPDYDFTNNLDVINLVFVRATIASDGKVKLPDNIEDRNKYIDVTAYEKAVAYLSWTNQWGKSFLAADETFRWILSMDESFIKKFVRDFCQKNKIQNPFLIPALKNVSARAIVFNTFELLTPEF